MENAIVLMTDFGHRDSYVGVMKGVIAGIAPQAQVIDLTHAIRPQDIAHAAYTLRVAVPYFPPDTIFCCVVDPGVGSTRRAVALELGGWRVVAPDNGIVTHLLERWPVRCAYTLTNPRYQLPLPSATFHGRDIFAPAAAHLAMGVSPDALGEPLLPATLCRLVLPATRKDATTVTGAVIHIDHFGNLVTGITAEDLEDRRDWRVRLAGTQWELLRIHATFASVAAREPVAYIGSDGFLELAIRNGNAAARWNVEIGASVRAERD